MLEIKLLNSSVTAVNSNILDQLPRNLQYILMILGAVFIVYICIAVILRIIKAADKPNAADSSESAQADLSSAVPFVNFETPNKAQFLAAVSAAIAEDMTLTTGRDASGFKILSVRRIGGAVTTADMFETPNKPQFIAAVTAAIAESMGKDVSSLRVLSVKRLSAGNPVSTEPQTVSDKSKTIAAISTAIAENMGKDVSNLRVLSVKKIS